MTTFTASIQTNHIARVSFTQVQNLTQLESKHAVEAKCAAVAEIASRHNVHSSSSWVIDRKSNKTSIAVTFETALGQNAVLSASQDLIDWLQESGLWQPAD